MAPRPKLTGFDWQLLEALSKNSRATVSELARELGRSRSSITEHLRKLIDHQVIANFGVNLNEEALGVGLTAFVRLEADSSQHREIVETVGRIPEVAECHVLTGNDLLRMRVVAKDMPHLRSLVDGFTNWGATTTDVIFSTVKPSLKVDKELRQKLRGTD
jgi:Lrp/AsnC family leucine-responsive transcriptional regulator